MQGAAPAQQQQQQQQQLPLMTVLQPLSAHVQMPAGLGAPLAPLPPFAALISMGASSSGLAPGRLVSFVERYEDRTCTICRVCSLHSAA